MTDAPSSKRDSVGRREGAWGERVWQEGDLSFELPPTPSAVPQARDAIRSVELLLSRQLGRDVRLMTSELVTNSVRHGGLDPDARIGLTVSVSPTTVRVEVTDAGPGFSGDDLGPAGDQQSGWGLYLVDRLAARWGIDRGDRTHVWFEVERAADSTSTV
jgi:anti-sigma regulatory factor (Ser/Thr protein kinase)